MIKYKNAQSSIIDNGVSSPNRFNIIIEIPQKLLTTINNEPEENWFSEVKKILKPTSPIQTTKTLSISTESTELPGKNISIVEVKYNGDYYKLPSGVIYGVLPLTLRVSRDMYEKDIIDKWMSLVYNSNEHVVNYYDDFTTTITIQQLDKNENIMYSVKLLDAFPTVCNPITYNQSEVNTYNRLSVSFAYRKWIKDTVNSSSSIGALSQTPLGKFLNPILSNPMVKKGMSILEERTGINLEGEAVNIYNNIDGLVKMTTGSSVNKNAKLLSKMKFNLDSNDQLSDIDKTELTNLVDDLLKIWK